MTTPADHWDRAYDARGSAAVSWYEPTPRLSLEMVASVAVPTDAPVIDIGGGASQFACELVKRGYADVTVLDVSSSALRESAQQAGGAVTFVQGDVLTWHPTRDYGLWHDRAVFHFFTDPGDRDSYLMALRKAVRVGGYVVLGVFAPDGPEKCSGLPVERYTASDLIGLLGANYEQRLARRDEHVTPRGMRQPFTWVALERCS